MEPSHLQKMAVAAIENWWVVMRPDSPLSMLIFWEYQSVAYSETAFERVLQKALQSWPEKGQSGN